MVEVSGDDLAQFAGRGDGVVALPFPAGPVRRGRETLRAFPGDREPRLSRDSWNLRWRSPT
jgi:hypothetical protein